MHEAASGQVLSQGMQCEANQREGSGIKPKPAEGRKLEPDFWLPEAG